MTQDADEFVRMSHTRPPGQEGQDQIWPIIARMTPLDVTKPNTARMYDYWLGGKDNFEADREAAEAIRQRRPNIAAQALDNKKFQTRAITHVAGQGVRQFLDIGSGLPTSRSGGRRGAPVAGHAPGSPGRQPGRDGGLRQLRPGGSGPLAGATGLGQPPGGGGRRGHGRPGGDTHPPGHPPGRIQPGHPRVRHPVLRAAFPGRRRPRGWWPASSGPWPPVPT